MVLLRENVYLKTIKQAYRWFIDFPTLSVMFDVICFLSNNVLIIGGVDGAWHEEATPAASCAMESLSPSILEKEKEEEKEVEDRRKRRGRAL